MSLRFIPDATKTSPLKMFLKYAERKEQKELKARQKKLLSFEYFLYTRGVLDNIFGFQGQFLNSILSEFNIEERKFKKILNDVLSDFEKRYFTNGKLNIEAFKNDYIINLNKISKNLKTNNEKEIVKIIVKKNEYKDIFNPEENKTFNELSEFKKSLEDRKSEMAFLTMYLAKTNKEDYNNFLNENISSQLINDITTKNLFIKMRNDYQEDLNLKVKPTKKLKAH